MTDIKLYETGNGGDIKLLGKDLETIEGFGNMIYLAIFGGNPGAVTPTVRLPAVQDFSWWGNSLLMPNDPSLQFNSYTEQALKTVALNSSGRIQIEQAIIKDLVFMKEFATIKVSTQITYVNRLRISIILQEPDNDQATEFVYLWDGTRQDLQPHPGITYKEILPPYVDPDALAFIEAVIGEGGTLDSQRQEGIKQWFSEMKGLGDINNSINFFSSRLKAGKLFVGEVGNGMLVDVKSATVVGSMFGTNTFNRKGMLGDGSTGKCKTGYIPSANVTASSQAFLLSIANNFAAGARCIMGSYSGSDGNELFFNLGNDTYLSLTDIVTNHTTTLTDVQKTWVIRNSSTELKLDRNGVNLITRANGLTANPTQEIYLNARNFSNPVFLYETAGLWQAWLALDGLSDAESLMLTRINEQFQRAVRDSYYVTFEGDSMTGSPTAPVYSDNSRMAVTAIAALGSNYAYRVVSEINETVEDITSQYAAQVFAHRNPCMVKDIECVWIGVNNLRNAALPGADLYTKVIAYIENAMADGFKVIVLGLADCTYAGTDPSYRTQRDIYRGLMNAKFATATTNAHTFKSSDYGDACVWVDIAADSRFDNGANLTYFYDGCHMTTLGYQIIGNSYTAPAALLLN